MNQDSNINTLEIDESSLTFKEILYKIIRARIWILSFAIVSFLIALYVSFSTPPLYNSTASIMIEKSNKAQTIFNFGVDDNFKISDEIAVIKSRTIAEDVVEKLWNSNKRNRLYVFGTKKFIPRGQRLRRPIKKLFSLGIWDNEKDKPVQYNEVYSKEIAAKFYKNIINSINVFSKRGTNIIYIKASSPHPYEAALIANMVSKSYKLHDKLWSSNESATLKTFLQDRLDEKELEMENLEQVIDEYKIKNQIYDIDGNMSNLLDNLTEIETQLNNSNLEINIIYSQKEYLQTQLSNVEKDLSQQMLSSINAQLSALLEELNEKESEAIKNSTIYGSNHEAVIKTNNDLKNLRIELENKTNELISSGISIIDPLEFRQSLIGDLLKIETDLHLLKSKASEYKHLINKYKQNITSLPEKQSYLGKLAREKKVIENTYSYMRQKMEEARVSMASEAGKVRIINQASEPRSPVSPNISKNLFMAIIIGSILGLSVNIVKEYFDNTIRTVEFISTKNLPVLSIIPSIQNNKNIKNKNNILKNGLDLGKIIERRLITNENPTSPISESYRGLRTSLLYTTSGEKKVVMVSSPGPGEGKTTTIINLAITYADLGKRTLLIDADLRKPVLHKVFEVENKLGLAHYLSNIEDSNVKIITKTNIKNLDLVLSGVIPPNPSELLGSERMKELLHQYREKYDIILFDAPPVMAVTDSVVLSQIVDQFVLVVRFGHTHKDGVNQTLASLNNVNTTIAGVVFNDFNTNNSYYSTKYYSYNEYYYTADKSI